jgi:hypothetical protein
VRSEVKSKRVTEGQGSVKQVRYKVPSPESGVGGYRQTGREIERERFINTFSNFFSKIFSTKK